MMLVTAEGRSTNWSVPFPGAPKPPGFGIFSSAAGAGGGAVGPAATSCRGSRRYATRGGIVRSRRFVPPPWLPQATSRAALVQPPPLPRPALEEPRSRPLPPSAEICGHPSHFGGLSRYERHCLPRRPHCSSGSCRHRPRVRIVARPAARPARGLGLRPSEPAGERQRGRDVPACGRAARRARGHPRTRA